MALTVPQSSEGSSLFAGLSREGEQPVEVRPVAAQAPAPVADMFSGLEREGEAIASTLQASGDQSPDEAARVLKASRNLGLPPEVVALRPDLQKAADAPTVDWAKFERRAPVVSRRLADDPMAMAVVRDDALALAAIEEEFKRFKRTPRLEAGEGPGLFQRLLDAVTGYDPARAAAIAPVELEARRQGKSVEALAAETFGRRDLQHELTAKSQGVGRGLVGTIGTMAAGVDWLTGSQAFASLGDEMRAAAVQGTDLSPDGATFASQLASGLGSMVAFWAPGVGLGVGAGALAKVAPRAARWLGVGAMSAAEALSEAGSAYQDAKAKGMSDDQADSAAAWVFFINLPFLAASNRFGIFGEKGGMVRRAVTGGVMEGAQEVVQELVSSGALGEETSFRELATAFGVGAILGGPAAVATGKVMDYAARPVGEPGETQMLQALERKVAGLKASQRDPQTVNALVADMAQAYDAPAQVYVPVEAVQTLFQAQTDQTAWEVLDSLGIEEEAYQEAAALGAPVAIPVDHLASAMLSPAWAAIRDQVSFAPREMVALQAQDTGSSGDEKGGGGGGDEYPPPPDSPQPETMATQLSPYVQKAIEQSLSAIGLPKAQAKASAVLVARVANTWARETGEDPMAYLGRRGFSFQRGEGSGQPASVGPRLTTMRTARGTRAAAQWEVVEAASLITSHDDSLAVNPAFPAELQPRDRSRQASREQVARIEKAIDPELLAENPLASDGAPVVGPDNLVESGNGRTIALRRAYAGKGKNAATYRAWLANQADRFGLSPTLVRGMTAPVLIRRRVGEVDRARFVAEANERAQADMSASEQSAGDAKLLLESNIMGLFEANDSGQVDTRANREFVKSFLALLNPNEVGKLRDNRTRGLSPAGETRIRNALFAAAYGESLSLEKLADSTSNRAKNITTALMMVAPQVAKLRQAIARGDAYDLDISPNLIEAADKLQDLRKQGVKLDDYLAQADLFADMDPLTVAVLRLYARQGTAGFRRLHGVLSEYVRQVEALGSPQQGGLWGQPEIPPPAQVLAVAEGREEGASAPKGQTRLYQVDSLDNAAPEDFIATRDGHVDLGAVPAETGRQAGPIRLQVQGYQHIEAQRSATIRQLGYSDALDFVGDVAANYDAVFSGGGGTLILVRRLDGEPSQAAVVRLKPHGQGDFWSVDTAYFVRRTQYWDASGKAKKPPLWEGTPNPRNPGDVDSGQSGSFSIVPFAGEVKTLAQGPKGSATFLQDGQAVIHFFESGDPSTIPHELAHVFRRDLQELAEREGAGEQIRADWQAATAWVGVKPGQEWTVAQEEQWARGFEAYLREGRAPAPELRGVFERFRKWLVGVYRAVRELGVSVTPEIREVFDRLLASDEEIAQARAMEVVRPMFETRPAWMPEAAWGAYQQMTAAAQNSIADKVLKHRLADYRRAKRTWVEDARREHQAEPGFEALRWAVEHGGVVSADLEAAGLDASAVRALERRKVAAVDGRASLVEVAERLGSDDPAGAIQYLADTPTESEFVAARVEEQTAEWDQGLHSWEAALTDEVLDLMKAEAEALTAGLTTSARRSVKAQIKQAVESETLGKLEGKLVSEKEAFRFGMLRAQQAAAKAFREGSRVGAANQKWRQFAIANRLKARQEAAREVKAMRADLKRLLRNRPKPGVGIEWDYDVQIRHLLANYGIARPKDRLPSRHQPLAAFVADLQAAGEAIMPAQFVLDEEQIALKDLTLWQLREVHATATQLAHIGRGQNEMLAHMRGASFQAVRDRLVSAIEQNGRQRFDAPGDKPPEFNQPLLGRLGQRWHDAVANNTKIEFLTWQLDGGQRMGEAWEVLFKGVKLAEDEQLRLEKEFSGKITALMKRLPTEFGHNLAAKKQFPFLPQADKTLSNEQVLAMALNMGNQGNMDALLVGWGIDRAQLDQIVSTLPPQAWDFVQRVWDTLEELFSHLDATHYAMTGTRLGRVEALPFTAPTGQDLRGGYYPLKWDPKASAQAEAFLLRQAEKDYFETPYKSGRPEQGFTAKRVGGKMAPSLSLSVLHKHLSDTIRYATHAPIIRDLNKLTGNQEVAAAISRVAGEAKYKQLKPWLQGVARPDREGLTGVERIIMKAQSNYTTAALAYSLKTVLMQPLAFFNGAAEIGAPAAAGGMLRYLASPAKLSAWLVEVSPYMAARREAMDRDLRQALRSGGRLGKGWDTFTRRWGFYLIGLADSITARGVWLGAYDQELRASGDQARAIERADQVVRATQGSGMPKDLPQVQRGTALHRAFTMFYTPFASTYNQIADANLSRDPMKIVRAYSWALVVPALLSALMDWAWDEAKGRDENLTAWRLVAGIPDYALGMLPMARLGRGLVGTAVNVAAGEKVIPAYEARGLPVITDPINKAQVALAQVGKGEYGKAALNTLQVLGPMTGVPSNAVGSYVKIAENLGD